MSSPKFALIGNGYIGQRHRDSIEAVGGELLMIADPDKSKRVEGIPHYTYWESFLMDDRWKEVEYVVVCCPNHLHIEASKWAVAHGRKALSEKPLAISSQELSRIQGVNDIFTVLQLRHHPEVKEMMKTTPQNVELHVKVKRDESYWNGWKGKPSESGGILFNLGIHYFDVLLSLMGKEYHSIDMYESTERKVVGTVRFFGKQYPVGFHLEIADDDDKQERYMRVDYKKYRFSNADNLSSEDLHVEVYRDLLKGEGVRPSDVMEVTKFIEKIYGTTV